MRMLLAGGGTGGHLFPAVAIAQQLLQEQPQAQVLFVGTQRGLEQRLIPQLGYALETVDMVGVVGRGWRGRLEILPKLLKSVVRGRTIIRQFKPDIVVGVGGYASVPLLLAARLAGLPCLIHEQNAFPGLSNKLLGRLAQRVCISFAQSAGAFSANKTVVTGNPLRQGFDSIAAKLPDPGTLLIFGGSRGARAINEAVVEMLPLLQEWSECPRILHQTGEEDCAWVRNAYQQAGFDPQQVVPFIDDMAQAYGNAHLVVCRAGATTLAELAVTGRPALMIPFPHAAADHQMANARAFEDLGAAEVLPQRMLSGEVLAMRIQIMFNDRERLQQMAAQCRSLGQPGAAQLIVQECQSLIAG